MRVLGVDPGTRVVGFGVVDHERGGFRPITYGAIRARASTHAGRYREIYAGLREVIEKHAPGEVAVEKVFTGKSPQSALRIGEGRGLALLAAAMSDLPVSEYAPTLVKKSVVGSGRGSKEQVQEMVRVLLGLREIPTPNDASDALAIAICHCHRRELPGPDLPGRELPGRELPGRETPGTARPGTEGRRLDRGPKAASSRS